MARIMKALTLLFLIFALNSNLLAQNINTLNTEDFILANKEPNTIYSNFEEKLSANEAVDEIKHVIVKSYVNGIHNGGPIQDIRDGFHTSFIMFRYTSDRISTTTISDWISSIEKGRESNNGRKGEESKAEFNSIQLEGNSASVTLDLVREGEKIFTDHLLLYKFKDGWKIISKTFYRH